MSLFKHKHKWQTRATNRYQICTYRVCLKCGEAEEWHGGMNGSFEKCERKKIFDDQFDEKDNYIFEENEK